VESTQTKVGPYRWTLIILWIACQATAWITVAVIGILLPAISEEFQLSYVRQGLLSSVPTWINVILTIPFSLWLTRARPVLLTTVTLVFGVFLVYLQASATIFIVLLISRLAFGMTLAVREPARAILMQQWFQPREFILVNGVTATVITLTYATVMFATPLFLTSFNNNWRATIYVLAGYSFVLTILWMIFARDKAIQDDQLSGEHKIGTLIKGIVRYKQIWITGLGFLGATMTLGCFLAFYPTYMLDMHHFPLTFSGLVLACSFLLGGPSSFTVSRITTTWQTRSKLLYISGMILPISHISLLLTDSLLLLLGIAMVNGIAWGVFWPILLTVTFHVYGIRPREIPIGHAFIFTAFSLGFAIGPLLGGLLQDMFNNLGMVLIILSLTSVTVVLPGFFVSTLNEDPTQSH